MEEIVKRILDKLTGIDFWIFVAFLAAAYCCWKWIGTKTRERNVLGRQIAFALVLVLAAGGAMWVNHFFLRREPVFTTNHPGILVMPIVGDDALNSLRSVLLEKLNAELQKEAGGEQIEVHAGRETLSDDNGLTAAHERARAIGQRLGAKLVIWGRKIGDKQFYPHITVVTASEDWTAARERDPHGAQHIAELQLPEELVDEPFYLIHFAAGYSYFNEENYKEALSHFKAALQRKGGSPNELADLQFVTAICDYNLGVGQKNAAANLQEAIGLNEKAAKVYEGVIRTNGPAPKTTSALRIATFPPEIAVQMCKRLSPHSKRRCGCIRKRIFRSSGL